MSSDEGARLIPTRLRAMIERLEPEVQLVPSPLPEPAFTYYVSGGCFSLALALHAETSLPIEVYFREDRPRHAYVVDDEMAIDARGRNPLRLVRGGAERLQGVEDEAGLVSLLEPASPEIRVFLGDSDIRECALRAAKLILQAVIPAQ